MDSIVDLLQPNVKSNLQNFKQYLSSCSEHQAFHLKGLKVDSVINQINLLLNSTKNRSKGFLLLQSYLPQCSPTFFAQHAFSWMQQCLKETDSNQATIVLEYFILGDLFRNSAEFIDLRKSVINTILPKFFEKLDGKLNYEVKAAQAKCLAIIMKYYAGACGPRRGVIDRFIQSSLGQFSVEDEDGMTDLCKCYLLLAQCGGGGNQGILHKGNWSQQCQTIINTAQNLLDLLFDSITEIQVSNSVSPDISDKKLGILDSIPNFDDPASRHNYLTRLFSKTMKLLQIMLLGAFPVAKSIPVVSILNVICRGLAVNCSSVSKKSFTTDKIALSSVIPFLHVELLKTLSALINCCHRNLIPYASLICKLCCQSLKWTSKDEWEYSLDKPYSSVRIATYNVLQSWLNSARLSSCMELFKEDFIQFVEKDIKYDKPSIKLQSQNQSNANSKGKKRKQQYVQDEEAERRDLGKLNNTTANKDVCCEALKTLQSFLSAASVNMTSDQHKALQTLIIKILLEIHQACEAVPIPYSDSSCRFQLYRTLYFLVLEPHSHWVSPIPYASHLFSDGLTDSCSQISSFCSEALSTIEKMVHPMNSSLNFPLEFSSSSNKDVGVVAGTSENFEDIVVEENEENGVVSLVNNDVDINVETGLDESSSPLRNEISANSSSQSVSNLVKSPAMSISSREENSTTPSNSHKMQISEPKKLITSPKDSDKTSETADIIFIDDVSSSVASPVCNGSVDKMSVVFNSSCDSINNDNFKEVGKSDCDIVADFNRTTPSKNLDSSRNVEIVADELEKNKSSFEPPVKKPKIENVSLVSCEESTDEEDKNSDDVEEMLADFVDITNDE